MGRLVGLTVRTDTTDLTETGARKDIADLTKTEIIERLKEKGVEANERMNKAELAALLEKEA